MIDMRCECFLSITRGEVLVTVVYRYPMLKLHARYRLQSIIYRVSHDRSYGVLMLN